MGDLADYLGQPEPVRPYMGGVSLQNRKEPKEPKKHMPKGLSMCPAGSHGGGPDTLSKPQGGG